MADRAKLVEGPVGGALLGLALPMSVGIIFLILLSLIDTYFVAQLGTVQLAAMSFTFPVITLVISVALGLSVGTTSAVSRALGAGDDTAVRRLTTHALALAVLIVLMITGVGLWTMDSVFLALGAEAEVLPLLDEYMTIWYAGAVFLVVPMVANGVLRAQGDAKSPMYMMMVAALVNGILDPILIFGLLGAPRWELAGAAIATLIARSVTLAVALWLLVRRRLLDLHIPSMRELMDSWRKVASVGIPAAITNALGPVATAVMTALIAREGHEAVAAYGVGSRVEGLLLIASFGLGAALTPFIGQNWGAHKVDRVAKGVRLSNRFVLVWGLGAWVVLIFGGRALASVFTDDPVVTEYAEQYLLIVPISYGASGVVSVVSAAFNAVDRAVRSTLLSAAKSLGLAVPLAFVGSAVAGVPGIFAGIAVSTILTGAFALWWIRSLTRPQTGEHEPEVAKSTIRGVRPALCRSIDELVERVATLPELEVRPRPINTIGFYAHGRELGHVHRTGHLDLHLPEAVGKQLIEEGKATHHRHHHETSWISHKVEDHSDAVEASWLLELALAIHRLVRKSDDDEGTKLLDDLDLSPALSTRVRNFADDLRRFMPAE